MYWNYRRVDIAPPDAEEPWLEIREVYYDDNHIPTGHCSTATGGEDEQTLLETYKLMAEAFDFPILNLNDFKGYIKEH